MNEELKRHVVMLLTQDKRLDGRKSTDYRQPISIEPGFVGTAEGSAKVTMGETEVIVGIKMEVGTPYPDRPDEGTIICGAELLPMSNPEFEAGPPGIQAVELARIVDRGIRESKTVDFKELCIKEGEKVWLILIDIVTLNDDGNLFDASALAAYAALKNAVFPSFDGEKIDYSKKTDKKLKLRNVPLSVTICKIGERYLVDPTTEEEKVTDARLTVASIEDGTICALQKGGEAPLSVDDVTKMIDIGIEKAKELRGVLNAVHKI
ncbi:MAG TPA: exosome complex protein Rrp42 [Candidatus Nanoarchaeia archaeon]|nr:exosome complex protein Rrp42 [Candidatus Nanoarchaeia archaeon]